MVSGFTPSCLEALSKLSCDALAWTSICCIDSPTVREASTRPLCLTVSVIPCCTKALNPGALIAKSYGPGGRFGKLYPPLLPVVAFMVVWRSEEETETDALGMLAPEASVT